MEILREQEQNVGDVLRGVGDAYAKNVGPEWPWFGKSWFFTEKSNLLREEEKEEGVVELATIGRVDDRRCARCRIESQVGLDVSSRRRERR